MAGRLSRVMCSCAEQGTAQHTKTRQQQQHVVASGGLPSRSSHPKSKRAGHQPASQPATRGLPCLHCPHAQVAVLFQQLVAALRWRRQLARECAGVHCSPCLHAWHPAIKCLRVRPRTAHSSVCSHLATHGMQPGSGTASPRASTVAPMERHPPCRPFPQSPPPPRERWAAPSSLPAHPPAAVGVCAGDGCARHCHAGKAPPAACGARPSRQPQSVWRRCNTGRQAAIVRLTGTKPQPSMPAIIRGDQTQ